jgi:hypothetical protein
MSNIQIAWCPNIRRISGGIEQENDHAFHE